MPIEITEHPFVTTMGMRRALVATPTAPLIVGHDKLEQLRSSPDTSAVDHVVIDHIAAQPHGTFAAFVFRGRNPRGQGSWRFDPALSEDERRELGYRLWRSHLVLNRFCAAAGMFHNIWFDWTNAEVRAFSSAADRLAQELRQWPGSFADERDPDAQLTQLDLWIVERHTFFLTMELDVLLTRVLPPRLSETERELPTLRALIAAAPKHAFNGCDWYDAFASVR